MMKKMSLQWRLTCIITLYIAVMWLPDNVCL